MMDGMMTVIARLENGKHVVIAPERSKVVWRYLTDGEMDDMGELKLDVIRNYIWFESKLETTLEQGITVYFAVIDGTNVMMNRFYE